MMQATIGVLPLVCSILVVFTQLMGGCQNFCYGKKSGHFCPDLASSGQKCRQRELSVIDLTV